MLFFVLFELEWPCKCNRQPAVSLVYSSEFRPVDWLFALAELKTPKTPLHNVMMQALAADSG
jgi:hypothetical protein